MRDLIEKFSVLLDWYPTFAALSRKLGGSLVKSLLGNY